ncbi:hypothetical protein ACQPYA_01365 [Micromonospora sp. CA-263727]|uniref:hypothetical protein n=1 Tax=Micromonospora sp. CA-263727 TaxID=3239967 RepID=UPI003D8AF642
MLIRGVSGLASYVYASRATGRALDSNRHQSGHPDADLGAVYTLPRNGGKHQDWTLLRP